jgi:hypothetical protein
MLSSTFRQSLTELGRLLMVSALHIAFRFSQMRMRAMNLTIFGEEYKIRSSSFYDSFFLSTRPHAYSLQDVLRRHKFICCPF